MKIIIIYQHCNPWKGSAEECVICASPLEAQKTLILNKEFERFYAGNDFYYQRRHVARVNSDVNSDVSKNPKQRPHARSKEQWEAAQLEAAAKEENKDEIFPWNIFTEDNSDFIPPDAEEDDDIFIF